ncbi:glycosyl hydrolase 2 galactose-binding domain-containing protein [Nocardia sp. NPDC101769]|uniref:glycosyl hydrolase 2 galactose-binding domain-containing protein n=1 Tax=Nocardia sp. NPDC101769 TaxID=3364333 RepID=UPI0037F48FE9
MRLVFHGLDTVVDIWLEGEPLGHCENMFRPAEFDVTGLLRGENELLLRFSPPLHGGRGSRCRYWPLMPSLASASLSLCFGLIICARRHLVVIRARAQHLVPHPPNMKQEV